MRQVALLLELLEFVDEQLRPVDVWRRQRKAGIARMRERLQTGHVGLHVDLHFVRAVLEVGIDIGPLGLRRVGRLAVLAIIAEGFLVQEGVVPQRAGRREGERIASLIGIAAREAAEGAFQVIGDIGGVDPGMAVGARGTAAAIEIATETA